MTAEIKKENVAVSDTLTNLIANIGTAQDKHAYSNFTNNTALTSSAGKVELSAVYRTDWVASKVVNIVPEDMTRNWRRLTGDIDPEKVKQFEKLEQLIDLKQTFKMAHTWGRLYGTGYIVMAIDDGKSPDEPLDIDNLKPNCLRHIKAIDRHMVQHQQTTHLTENPLDPNFGLPEHYVFRNGSVKIHNSRLLRFDGKKVSYDDFRENNYNHDSVLVSIFEDLKNFALARQSVASMIYETNVDIIKVNNLMGLLANEESQKALLKRFTLAKVQKSFNNMLLLGDDEEHSQKTNTFSALPDLLLKFGLFLSGGSDIVATRLLGSSASGLNATGEGDLKNYYDNVSASQESNYRPKLNVIDRVIAKHLGFSDDADLSFEFNSLHQMTEKEEAELQEIRSRRDVAYLDRGVISEEIAAKELKQNKTYTNIDQDWIDELSSELSLDA